MLVALQLFPEPTHGPVEDTRQPPAPAEREQEPVERRRPLDDGRERHAAAAVFGGDVPADRGVRTATDIRCPTERRRWVGGDHPCSRFAGDSEGSTDPDAAAVAAQMLELEEMRLQPPVVAQIREKGEDRVGRLWNSAAGSDRPAYQPRDSSNSSGASAAAERPLIASPRPRETRARTSASL
jgi:hypothetical protein